jgi:4-hydroxybenzoate polyprenyltransferase
LKRQVTTGLPPFFGAMLLAFFQLIRWPNILMLLATQLLVRYCLIGPAEVAVWGDPLFLLLVGSTLCIAAGGYIINDYHDVKIDLINKPDRVVVGRRISRRWAMLIYLGLALLALALGALASWKALIVNALAGGLLWLYASYFKKQPFWGNVLVALLMALSLVILTLHFTQNRPIVVVFAIFCFGLSLIREIVKDMEDVRGDARHGCRTLPIIWGIPQTKLFVYCLLVIFLGLFLGLIYGTAPSLRLFGWLFVGPLGWFVYRFRLADTQQAFAWLSGYVKILLLLGLAGMFLV